MLTDPLSSQLKTKILDQLNKSRKHLEYSYNKVKKIEISSACTEEELEVLESFSSRFARYTDLVVSKYMRFLAKEKDPAFNGSIIDLLNLAEKWGVIQSAQIWKRIRELRNIAAHEYGLDDYCSLYREIFELTSECLKVKHLP